MASLGQPCITSAQCHSGQVSAGVMGLVINMGHFRVFLGDLENTEEVAYNPPKKNPSRRDGGPKGLQHCVAMLAPSGPESLRDGFFGGGLKGNCQKKYTMEVKTVKARKSDRVV